ncbi:hypothetical protein [Nocardia sp. NPDC004711]
MTAVHTGRVLRLPLPPYYLARRVLTGPLAVWGAVTVVFFALSASGNPAVMLVAPDAPAGELQRVSRLYGFDRPLYEQYVRFLVNMFSGNFPKSLRYNSDPLTLALDRLAPSATLGAAALAFGVFTGGIIGYVAATGRSPWLRRLLRRGRQNPGGLPTRAVGRTQSARGHRYGPGPRSGPADRR